MNGCGPQQAPLFFWFLRTEKTESVLWGWRDVNSPGRMAMRDHRTGKQQDRDRWNSPLSSCSPETPPSLSCDSLRKIISHSCCSIEPQWEPHQTHCSLKAPCWPLVAGHHFCACATLRPRPPGWWGYGGEVLCWPRHSPPRPCHSSLRGTNPSAHSPSATPLIPNSASPYFTPRNRQSRMENRQQHSQRPCPVVQVFVENTPGSWNFKPKIFTLQICPPKTNPRLITTFKEF